MDNELEFGDWMNYASVLGNGGTTNVTIPLPVNVPAQYFRVVRP